MATKYILTVFLAVVLTCVATAQGGSYYSLKGGLTLSNQRWDGFERDPFYALHAAVAAESYSEDDRNSLFAQIGYHPKGSAIRNQLYINPFNGNINRPPAQEFIFRNLSLVIGAKQKFPIGVGASKVYYILAIRGDYTLGTNLSEYEDFNLRFPAYAVYPFNDKQLINEFNYGVTAGGGVLLPFSELVAVFLEFTVNPDFSYQYRQPEVPNVIDPFTGQNSFIPERQIRNLSFELSLGFRFLRKVIYID